MIKEQFLSVRQAIKAEQTLVKRLLSMVLSSGIMKKYELMTIVRAQASDAERKEFVGIVKKMITDLKGDLEAQEERGKREFSYPIKKQKSGYYILFNFLMEPAALSVFETKVRQHETVLRHLLLVKEEVKASRTSSSSETFHPDVIKKVKNEKKGK